MRPSRARWFGAPSFSAPRLHTALSRKICDGRGSCWTIAVEAETAAARARASRKGAAECECAPPAGMTGRGGGGGGGGT